jgi:hypothetical protein
MTSQGTLKKLASNSGGESNLQCYILQARDAVLDITQRVRSAGIVSKLDDGEGEEARHDVLRLHEPVEGFDGGVELGQLVPELAVGEDVEADGTAWFLG